MPSFDKKGEVNGRSSAVARESEQKPVPWKGLLSERLLSERLLSELSKLPVELIELKDRKTLLV